MTRSRLKVFQAHLGFCDTVVAAPSQKAALADVFLLSGTREAFGRPDEVWASRS